MSIAKDDDLLAYFPDKKKTADLSGDNMLDMNAEDDAMFLLSDDDSDEDEAGVTTLWEGDETTDIEDEEIIKPDFGSKSAFSVDEGEEIDHEVIDDPVHVYLREIGKVQLLTAKDEKILASKLEEAKYLRKIEDLYFQQYDNYPSVEEVAIYLLRHLLASKTIVDKLDKILELSPDRSFTEKISDEKLQNAINGVIDPNLITTLSESDENIAEETEQYLINLSLDIRLLPPELVSILDEKASWSEIETLANDPINPEFFTELRSRMPS